MILDRRISEWPDRQRDDYLERWAIMEFDANMTTAEAQRKAEADIRRHWGEREQAALWG